MGWSVDACAFVEMTRTRRVHQAPSRLPLAAVTLSLIYLALHTDKSSAASPHGCPGPSTPPTNARATRARSARPSSRSPGPLSQSSAHLPYQPHPTRETTWAAGRHTRMHARLSGARQARTHRQRGPSVAVRGKPAVTPTARQARTPSAIRPWTTQHDGLQRDKMTHHGIEKNGPPARDFAASKPFSQGVAGGGFEPPKA
jgi:hypothetical protein